MSAARHALAVLACALGAVGILLGPGMPTASAHDALVATSPAPDAAAPSAPVAVTLEFSRAVEAFGAQVHVTGPDGGVVSQGAAEVRDATAVQPLAADAPAGRYTVTWRVTSSDGHPLSGEFAFTVATGAPTAADLASSAAGGAADAEVSETAARQTLPSSPSPVGPIAVGAALVALAGGLVVVQRRRRT